MKTHTFLAAVTLAVPAALSGLAGLPSASAAPAASAPVSGPVSPDATSTLATAKGAVASKVVITDRKNHLTIKHDLTLGAGWTTTATGSTIDVRTGGGVLVAQITGAVARDENGQPVPTSLSLDGKNVMQRIDARTAAPGKVFARLDVVRPGQKVDARVNADLADKLAHLATAPPSKVTGETTGQARTLAAAAAPVPFVAVPSAYVYDVTLNPVEWHDYCSYSPDSWWSADFRGPCARHDLAYMAAGKRVLAADDQLKVDLDTNCSYAYGKYNPSRYECYGVATVYHDVVAGITESQGA